MTYKLLFLVLLFLSGNVLAKCGSLPQPPLLLKEARLNTVQLERLDDQLQSYFQDITAFQDCIDRNVGSLDYERDGYQTAFEEWMRLMDMAEEQKQMAISRFNTLIETVDVDLIEENQQEARGR